MSLVASTHRTALLAPSRNLRICLGTCCIIRCTTHAWCLSFFLYASVIRCTSSTTRSWCLDLFFTCTLAYCLSVHGMQHDSCQAYLNACAEAKRWLTLFVPRRFWPRMPPRAHLFVHASHLIARTTASVGSVCSE